ncbi:MAG: pentapeptide repeat-containing protein [Clostridia bacterium]|nr:pentapeptide repeat-containing protein [Clostridia bacterium]
MELLAVSTIGQNVDFKQLEKSTFIHENFMRSTIRNSIISNCNFEDVNMQNCDLISTKILSSNFDTVSFDSADLLSLWFVNCNFRKVNFTGAGLEDITFIDCLFEECCFEDTGLKNCDFKSSTFKEIHPDSCGFSLNNYEDCSFYRCTFGGTFHYQIFKNCKFKLVNMDCNILKYNYGLGKTNGISYIYKTTLFEDTNTLKNFLLNECIEQKHFLNAVLLDYNFSNEINPKLAFDSIKALQVIISNDILLQNEELQFLKQLYHYLYINKLIAPIVLYKLFEEIKNIYLRDYKNISYLKCKDSLYMVANSLYIDFCDFCEQLKKQAVDKINYSTPIYIKIHYTQKPGIELATFLNQCYPGVFKQIATEVGSFIEIIEAGQYGLELLNIFIQLLGIGIPIIYSEIKEKHKKKPIQTKIQKDIEVNISNFKNEQATAEMIQKTCQLINSSDILVCDQQGYNNNNIKEIKVKYKINIQA